MRFVVSVVFGLVAEFATGIVIGIGLLLSGVSSMRPTPGALPPWVPWVAIVGGGFLTFCAALWRARSDRDRALLHASLVTIAAIAFHLASSIGSNQPFTVYHAVADVCKAGAGVAAAMIARRPVIA